MSHDRRWQRSPIGAVQRRRLLLRALVGAGAPMLAVLAGSKARAAVVARHAETAAARPALTAPAPTLTAPITLPRDFGAHPDVRTEWWYLTGALVVPGVAEPFGFQLTFFRSRTDVPPDHPSAFAARQLIFAHAALTDPVAHRLRHDQRIAREGFGIAQATASSTPICACATGACSASRLSHGHDYVARVAAPAQRLRASICACARRSRCCCRATPAFRARGPTRRNRAAT